MEFMAFFLTFFICFNKEMHMTFKVGDFVTRISYQHDIVFKIIKIKGQTAYLKGMQVRLYADAPLEDLQIYVQEDRECDEDLILDLDVFNDRGEFFYMPGKVLHIDADEDYLKRCIKFYKINKVKVVGKKLSEEEVPKQIFNLLKEYQPDIVIITGHDAYYPKKGSPKDCGNYRNSMSFIKAVKEARRYEKSHEKLVIIAGACQSNYEELIRAGANFASSPKRINIHCLDPAIIATVLSMTERNKEIDLVDLLSKTKYGPNGMGGIKSNGMMYVGFPR